MREAETPGDSGVERQESLPALNRWHAPALDHVRALAALLVLAFHLQLRFPAIPVLATSELLALLRQGYVGVSLFLTLSGFLFMHLALERGAPRDYWQFLRNRLLRVAPLFIVVYVLAISIHRELFRPGDLVYLLITNIGKPPTSEHFVTGPAWSISLELAFYLIFPLLVRFVLQGGLTYLIRLTALLLVFKVVAFVVSDAGKLVMYSTLIGRLDQFLIGMAAALLTFRSRRLPRAVWRLALTATIASLLGYGVWLERHAAYPSSGNPWQWILLPSLEALLFASLIACSLRARLPVWRWLDAGLCWIALISYSLYLLHPLPIVLVESLRQRGGVRLGDGWAALLCTVLALALSALSYHTIEAPFLQLKTRAQPSAGS